MRYLAVLLLLAGTAQAAPCVGLPGDEAVTVQLFFGRSMKGGALIDAEAWKTFLAESVTPRFPSGLTVLEGSGQWQQHSTGRVISEPSTVVVIVTEGTAEDFSKFEAIRGEYKRRFAQESVGLVSSRSCASW
jgi:hypothetical protein